MTGKSSLRASAAMLLCAAACALLFLAFRGGSGDRLIVLCDSLKKAALAAAVLCAAGLVWRPRMKPENYFTLMAVTFGLCYLFFIVPLSSPDEFQHYRIALTQSGRLLTGDCICDAHYFDFRGFESHVNSSEGLLTFFNGLLTEKPVGYTMYFPACDTTYPIQYIPQTLMFLIGQALGLNRLWLYLLGDIADLTLYILLARAAIRIIPRGKLSLTLCALVPMALQQASSLSCDSFIIGMSFLTIALMLRAMERTEPMTLKEMIAIAVPAVLVSPPKAIYFLYLGMLFLIPASRFSGKKQRWLFIGLTILAAAAATFYFQFSHLSAGLDVKPEEVEMISLGWVLSHIPQTVTMFLKTLFPVGIFSYIENAVGAQLSGMTLNVTAGVVYAMLFILLMTGLSPDPGKKPLKPAARLTFIAISVMIIGAAMASMLIAWTPVGCETILGIQGRYFTPLMPLLLLAFQGSHFTLNRRIDLPCQAAFVVLQYLVLNDVVNAFL